MIGNLNKDYNFSIIVNKQNIKDIYNLVASNFKSVKIEFKTSEGAEYNVDNIDNILGYSNPKSRRIIVIRFEGDLRGHASFLSPNISIVLSDTSTYYSSISLSIKNMEEKDIVYYTREIEEFSNSIKAPYWWLHKSWFYTITGFALYLLCAVLYFTCGNTAVSDDKAYNILILQGISALCMVISMYGVKKIVSVLFPECSFCIGEQENYILRQSKLRKFIFGTIIGTIVLGVLSSIIAYFITSSIGI